MEDFTLRMIWELFRLSHELNVPVSITSAYVIIGDFKFFHARGRLDEMLPRCIGMAHAHFKDQLYPEAK